ncbi:MAG: VWA domain-containing protein [Rhodospirillales bacterium]|nr:VWA domain-containing protein [Rhodospirillales bacterium]MDH3912685.1 VWA domain-containing protein [Rhodospirillales bacterium]MDH3918845.1 VWA domain-containing protein [Rhodospirillales bacterium]MDH3966886.1 VWA domain-containing protein [Rhodospirillales bacterium]
MDERQLKEILGAEAVPPADENARKQAINLALAAFDEARRETRKKRQGFGLLGRLIGRDRKRSKGRPMRKSLVLGGSAAALLMMVATASVFTARSWLDAQRAGPQRVLMLDKADAGRDPGEKREREFAAAEQAAPAPTIAETKRKPAKQPSVDARGQLELQYRLSSPMQGGGVPILVVPSPGDVVPPHYQDVGRDQFQSVEQNPVKRVAEDPVSTFSIDVDTASYAFVRRQLNHGVLPQKDAVRIEELINYFTYAYPLPEARERPFETTVSVTPSPWKDGNKLIHIGIKGYDIEPAEKPRSNLVFLLDVSGSMNAPDKLPLMVNSMKLLLDTLGPEDTVAIVVYAGAAGTVLEPTKVAEKNKILAALDRLQAGGSTAGAEGIRQAYALAEASLDDKAVNRVILATDGDFNVGITNREELKDFIERKRDTGVFLSVLGFGQGNLNDHLMQTLAQNGNGVAAHIDTLNEARKVLVEEASSALFPIAKDVKIQVDFNPRKVAEYRLIGYETRALAREDFSNDQVDAGDIGAGHTVTAIYEITPVGSENRMIEPSRYETTAAVSETPFADEYAFLKIRYKLPDQDRSTLITTPVTLAQESATGASAREAQWATAVAAFGQLLKGGKYTGAYTYDDVIALAQGAKGDDRFGYRAEFINLVRLARTASALPKN